MRPRVIVVGGGYAGLSALSNLRRLAADVDLILIDPKGAQTLRTRLHERIRHPDARWQIPFARIVARYGCRHFKVALDLSPETLCAWDEERRIPIGEETLAFDYLVVATGSRCPKPPAVKDALTPDDLASGEPALLLRKLLPLSDREDLWITVVGAGASGIQLLFELAAWRRQNRAKVGLRLINAGREVLEQFPQRMRRYAQEKIANTGIDYLSDTLVTAGGDRQLIVQSRLDGKEAALRSDLTLACLGLLPNPFPLQANVYGQVLHRARTLKRIFAAGDVSVFAGEGANILSAQVAVQKGRRVAQNILRHRLGLSLLPYRYREQGYFVSMGSLDGAGWLGWPENTVSGLPAFFIKEAVEAGYELSVS